MLGSIDAVDMVHFVGWCPEISRHLGTIYCNALLSTMLKSAHRY
jgi:hypothetical protein